MEVPKGGPLSEPNRKRSVGWSAAVRKIVRPTLRVPDPRHTCASLWLGVGADPKVVQRILGHASAAMTMDLYSHMIDQSLWTSAKRLGGVLGASEREAEDHHSADSGDEGARPAVKRGADDETRTRDIDLGKVALYQLSYIRMRR